MSGAGVRSGEEIALRCLALDAARFRLSIEQERADYDAGVLERAHTALFARVDLQMPKGVLTDEKTSWVRAPLGTLQRDDELNISWTAECLAALCWTLGRCGLPAYDEQSDHVEIRRAIPPPGDSCADFLRASVTQTANEVARQTQCYETLLWRLRSTPERGARVLSAVVRDGVSGGDLPLVEGDISIRGVPAYKYTREDQPWRQCHSIALERLRAFRWLVGECSWDTVSLDT